MWPYTAHLWRGAASATLRPSSPSNFNRSQPFQLLPTFAFGPLSGPHLPPSCSCSHNHYHFIPTRHYLLTIRLTNQPASNMASREEGAAPKLSSSVKLVLLGEAAVGKSSLVLRFVNDDFQENKEPTIGAAFLTQKCNLPTRTIKFEIWDTAGQERFASLAPMYYRNAQTALVVYDITKPTSLTKAKHWVAELQRQASPGIVIALVGNKLDLASTNAISASADDVDEAESEDRRAIPTSEAKAYAEEEGLLFYETSAKTGENVQAVFEAIANAIPESTLKPRGGAGGGMGGGARAGAGEGHSNAVNMADATRAAKEGCAC